MGPWFLTLLTLSLPRGSPLTSTENRLALDRGKSISALRAPTAVKALMSFIEHVVISDIGRKK